MSEIIRSLPCDLNNFGADLHLFGNETLSNRHPGEHRGSFFAGHGVGTEKRHAYLTCGNPARRAVTQTIKAALDLKHLFNPGKVPRRAD